MYSSVQARNIDSLNINVDMAKSRDINLNSNSRHLSRNSMNKSIYDNYQDD